jgi:tetratricopeptide (TPR) repeat protein
VLVRDVAYGSIPRAGRAERHRLAAEWLESLSEDRTEDRAELLAHHYGEALELARASGALEEATKLEEPARRYLIMAGDRAFRLDVEKAASYYEKALAALAVNDPERARLAVKIADTAQEQGRLHEAVAGYEVAIPTLQSQGEVQATGEAMVRLASALWRIGDTARSRTVLQEAVELLEREPLGPYLVRAYARTAVNNVLAGRAREGLELTAKALPLAEQLGLHEEVVRVLQMRGIARRDLGDLDGLEDLRRALELGLELGLGFETASSYTNLGEAVYLTEGPASALRLQEKAVDFALKHGLTHHVWWTRAALSFSFFDLGRWEEALRISDEVIEWDRSRGRSQIAAFAETTKALIHIWRGELEEGAAVCDDLVPKARAIGDLQTLAPALAAAALLEERRGRHASARRLLEELDEIGVAVGASDLAAPPIENADLEGAPPFARYSVCTANAALAESRGEPGPAAKLYLDAAERWCELGFALERSLALLGLGRCLIRLRRLEDARASLAQARELLAGFGAQPLVSEADALLEEAAAEAS